MKELTLIALPGSLRRESLNARLLHAAAALAPEGVAIEVASLSGIPLYNADEEAVQGIPSAVAALKDRIAASDGLLLASPEYNSGIPGVFKNAIDWLSRPPKDIGRVFHDRPVALMGATPGGMGTVLAQGAWLPVLRALKVQLWNGGRMTLSRAPGVFDDDGQLVDEDTRTQLRDYVAGFSEFIRTGH